MFQYIARRLLQFIPVFFGVTLILFLIANYLPGADPVQLKFGEKQIPPERKAQIVHQLGLDRPWYVQYGDYLSSLSIVHMTYYDGSTPATSAPAPAASIPTTPAAGGTTTPTVPATATATPVSLATPAAPGTLVASGTVALFIPKVPGPVPGGPVIVQFSDSQITKRGGWGRFAIGSLAVEFDKPDLGTSLATGRPVIDILSDAYPYTVELALAAILLEIVFGIGAGIVSAVKQYSFWDILVTLTSSVLVSLPVFWLGIMLQQVFGIWLKNATGGAFYLPPLFDGSPSAKFPHFAYLILPAITLASVSTAYAARIMRSQLLEVNGADYIRTARAKGLSAGKVLWKHAMKNAMIPVVTFIGLDFGAMLAGAILTETVFNWPGIGWTIYKAIVGKDFPIVFGGVTVVLVVVMVVNLIVDVSYAFLDPRIRYGEGGE